MLPGLRRPLATAVVQAALLAAVAAAPAHAVAGARSEAYAALCESAIVAGARRGGVPVEVLHAIALTETGRSSGGRLRPWPWAINREGTGHWFASRDEALAFARASIAARRPSFDVGCVQINYRWHGHAFPSIEAMMDPEWTATYAAQFLRTLYESRGSWSEAAGAYHSLTPHFAEIYRARFDRILAGLAPIEIDAPRLAAAPRAARRDRTTPRREPAVTGPLPDAAPGSLAGGLLAPAPGVLVGGGGPLLTEGSPLLGAPPASLF